MIKELIMETVSLPDGWEIKTLGEVCEVIAGQSPQSKFYNTNKEGLAFYQGKKEFTDKYIGKPTKWTTKITKKVYHLGASLKDLGKKRFAFSKIDKDSITIINSTLGLI